MATAPKPLKRKYSAEKGGGLEPQKVVDLPTNNLHREPHAPLKDMGFKVSDEFKREFKIAASSDGLSMVDYLRKIHDFYQQHRHRSEV